MKEILTFADLKTIEAAGVFPQQFLNYIEREWLGLYEAYSEDEDLKEFSLAEHDRQVLLEYGDQVPKDLSTIEYVELVQLDGLELYRMYSMETEGKGTLYYSVVGTLDEETERFLKEQAEWNER